VVNWRHVGCEIRLGLNAALIPKLMYPWPNTRQVLKLICNELGVWLSLLDSTWKNFELKSKLN